MKVELKKIEAFDLFAAHAMSRLIDEEHMIRLGNTGIAHSERIRDDIAKEACAIADAMMVERRKYVKEIEDFVSDCDRTPIVVSGMGTERIKDVREIVQDELLKAIMKSNPES